MNQKLSNWASIAEIISGIAVVVTLLFLVLEVRDNTNVMRATAFERNIQSFIDSRYLMAGDSELTRIAVEARGVGYRSLTPLEQDRARVFIQATYLSYEKAYFAERYGLLGEGEGERFTRQACLTLPGYVPELRERVLAPLTNDYIEHLRSAPECEESHSWLASWQPNGN